MSIQTTDPLEAGIYFHIPFCKQACHYCNFHFSTSLKNKAILLHAIGDEIELRKKEWQNSQYKSIYFGGGTPSLLNFQEIKDLLDKVNSNFQVNKNAEITFEANPDDLSKAYLKQLKDAGINRLSIGVQSFRDKDLKFMNRAHSAKEAEEVLWLAKDAGFEQISIDLIYGIPGLNSEEWLANLELAAKLPINHISCYALTLEPNTAYNHFVKRGKYEAPDDASAKTHFYLLRDFARQKAWDQYEISNIAIDGARAVHNSGYWNGNPYFGLGPSAHSFDGEEKRMWNVSNNAKYIKGVKENSSYSEFEILSKQDRFNECLMTGLRRREGVSFEQLSTFFPNAELADNFLASLNSQRQKGYLDKKEGNWVLNEESIFLADSIISDLFWV